MGLVSEDELDSNYSVAQEEWMLPGLTSCMASLTDSLPRGHRICGRRCTGISRVAAALGRRPRAILTFFRANSRPLVSSSARY